MLSIFPYLLDYQFYGPLLLRLALGAVFLIHGYQKLVNDKTQFAGWAEFLGGICLILGFLTQLAALILAIEFFVILFWFKRGQKFVGGPPTGEAGWELDFIIFFALAALLVLGPGAWAIDLPL